MDTTGDSNKCSHCNIYLMLMAFTIIIIIMNNPYFALIGVYYAYWN